MSTSTMALESPVSLFHRVSNVVSSNLSLEEMLGEILGLTVQVTGCDACLVYLIDHEANEMVLRASQVPHAADLGELRIKMGEGVTGWVAEHRSVVALPSHASADPRFKRFQALVEDTYEAFLSVPIVSGGESIGVINVHHRESHEHNQEEISMLIFIGEQTGGVVSKAKLMEEAATVRRQLEDRKLVERAKGIIQHKYSTTEEDAYFRLRNQSRRLRRPMRDLAEAIILAEDMQNP